LQTRGEHGGPELRIAHGPRQIEADFLERVNAFLEADEGWGRLARPLHIIVPSRSLEQHLARVLMQRFGALAGVRIDTAAGLARDVVQACGDSARIAPGLFEVLARRAARKEPTLEKELGGLDDGYGAVAGTLRDLIDAAFDATHLPAYLEHVEAEFGDGPLGRRAAALGRAAAGVLAQLDAAGARTPGALFLAAARILAEDPEGRLPAGGILLYGFANSTGALGDLLEVLARHPASCTWVDQPQEPGGDEPMGNAHIERLIERLGGTPDFVESRLPAPGLELVSAPGVEAEARAVMRSTWRSLEAGVSPESILIVARDLEPYRAALRRHARRLGVPFSGAGERGFTTPEGRRLNALRDLLRGQGDAQVERWLDAAAHLAWTRDGDRRTGSEDLRVAYAKMGITRLHGLAEHDPAPWLDDKDELSLPVRRGFRLHEGKPYLASRKVPGFALRAAAQAASAWLESPCIARNKPLSFGAFARSVRKLTRDGLGWQAQSRTAQILERALGQTAEALSEGTFDADELMTLFEHATREATRDPLGGAGGGVQVLSVTEARGHTAEQLFVLGMGRGVFPRNIHEDAVLPDRLRRRLRDLLPDLPVKQEGFAEERYLFAQLCAASPFVTLSWQSEDEAGKATPASPLVERLLQGGGSARAVRSVLAPPLAGDEEERPADEWVQLAGLHGTRADYERLLPTVLGNSADAARDHGARIAILNEQSRSPRATPDLGPYYGFVGSLGDAAAEDPRNAQLYVTALERVASCPWETFLTRVLKLELRPDPLAGLPQIHDKRLVGIAVHAVLEEIVRAAGAPCDKPLEDVIESPPTPVAWPSEEALSKIVRETCLRALRDSGIPHAGLARGLERVVRPYIERAAELDSWKTAPVDVLGAELTAHVGDPRSADSARKVYFKADRVDAGPRLTDYKTGKPISTATQEKTREKHFNSDIGTGSKLQANAYASVAEDASGRYLFTKADLDDDNTTFETHATGERQQTFLETLGKTLDAWEDGLFFPRLLKFNDTGTNYLGCKYCEVRSACMQDDTSYRSRFERYVTGLLADEDKDDPILPLYSLQKGSRS